ncbi:hypothetical protein CN354_20025 [Bacillus cereus]|nr:hypothetical protein CN354_20025 [Bacillus cereus]WJE51076.1 hypothetical protein QRE66_17385 [Bacillus cereus]
MSDVRKQRIEILRSKVWRNAQRKDLINKVSKFIPISIDSFMDRETNSIFCKELFSKLDNLSDRTIFGNMNYEENRKLSLELLEKVAKIIQFPANQGRLFFFREHGIEAVKLDINEIFDNLEEISIITNFLNGYGDFILVGDDLEFGVCIERTEYHYEFSMWGVAEITGIEAFLEE